MNEAGTMHTGPLGSTIHVLRADAETIAELAAVDLHGRKDTHELRAEFLALSAGSAPRALNVSHVLEGLTPSDVCEAVSGVRLSLTSDERTEAVTRIVRRQQRTDVRVHEEEGAYSQDPREPVATDEGRQGPGRTENRSHHG